MTAVVRALRLCRRIIREQRHEIIMAHCLIDRWRRPLLETLDESVKPEVKAMDRALKAVDLALAIEAARKELGTP